MNTNIDPEVEKKRKELTVQGLSGLRNIGNTCYMNSIIQCISSLDLFRSWLITDQFKSRLRNNIIENLAKKQRKKLGLTDDDTVRIRKVHIKDEYDDTITYNLSELLKGMWNYNSIITPKSFKNSIGNACPMFKGFNQHDSQELLNLIIDRVHEETKAPVKVFYKNIPECVENYLEVNNQCSSIINNPDEDIDDKEKHLNYLKEYKREHSTDVIISDAYVYWKKYIHKSHSIVTDLFTGLFLNKITCSECGNISSIFEPFTSLSIQTKEYGETTLKESMDGFTSEETLTGINQYFCEVCNKKVDAKKKIYIWEPPNILIIHLKRFKNERHYTTKTRSKVVFPIDDFDVTDYMSELHTISNTHYELKAISEHQGSYGFGHYIAYCKNSINNKWYEFNDDDVIHVPYDQLEKEIVTTNAYVLFYVRKFSQQD